MKIILAHSQQYLEKIGIDTQIAKALMTYFDQIRGSKKLKVIIRKIRKYINKINQSKDLIKNPQLIDQIVEFEHKTPIDKIMDEAKVNKETAEYSYSINNNYAIWIAKLFKNKNIIKGEDDQKVKERLEQFSKMLNSPQFPQKLKDINQYKTFAELAKMLDQNSLKKSKKQKQKQKSLYGSKIVYDKNGIVITKITTSAAAKIAAQNTEWCVKDTSYAASYLKDGPLYMVEINGEKVALVHKESNQIKDIYDGPLKIAKIILKIDNALKDLDLNTNYGDFKVYNEIKRDSEKFNMEFKKNEKSTIKEIKENPEKYDLLFEENQTENIKKIVALSIEQKWKINKSMELFSPLEIYNESQKNIKQYLSEEFIKYVVLDAERLLKKHKSIAEKQDRLRSVQSLCNIYQYIPQEIREKIPKNFIKDINEFILNKFRKDARLYAHLPFPIKKMTNENDLHEVIWEWFNKPGTIPYRSLNDNDFPMELFENEKFAKACLDSFIKRKNPESKDPSILGIELNDMPPEVIELISDEDINTIHENIVKNAIYKIKNNNNEDPELEMCIVGFHAYNTGEDCQDELPHSDYFEDIYEYSTEQNPRYFDFKNPEILKQIYNAVKEAWIELMKNTDEDDSEWNKFKEYSENINRYSYYYDDVENEREKYWESFIENDPLNIKDAPEEFIQKYTWNTEEWIGIWTNYISNNHDTESIIYDEYLDLEHKLKAIINAGFYSLNENICQCISQDFYENPDGFNYFFENNKEVIEKTPILLAYLWNEEGLDKEIYNLMIQSFVKEMNDNYENMEIYSKLLINNIPEVKQKVYEHWYKKILNNIEYYKTNEGLHEIKMSPAKDIINYMEIKNALYGYTELEDPSKLKELSLLEEPSNETEVYAKTKLNNWYKYYNFKEFVRTQIYK